MKKGLKLAIILSSAILIGGCASVSTAVLYKGASSKDIYQIGHKEMIAGDFDKSIQTLSSLNIQYPLSKDAEKGAIDLIYMYVQNGEDAKAFALCKRFVKIYPTSKNIGYVYYMAGVVYFNNGRGFLQSYFPYSMAEHDPSVYIKAYHSLQSAIETSPKATFVQDAKRRMAYLNNVIGGYYYNIAKYYFDRQAYVSAITRAQTVIKKYPQSSSVEPALKIVIKSYNILGLSDLADKSAAVLKANFTNK